MAKCYYCGEPGGALVLTKGMSLRAHEEALKEFLGSPYLHIDVVYH